MNSSAPQNTNKSRNENSNQNIRVYVRVRPLNTREKIMRSLEIVEVASPKDIIYRHSLDSKVSKKFTFDRTFGQDSKQSEVYHTVVAPLIEEVLAGYNCTVFAYGQTGTGKTHTMVGVESPELRSSYQDDSSVGIIPRALCHMLDELRLMEVEYTMRISYLELYNEELCDLLSTDDSVKIRIFDDSTKKGSVIIQGLEEVIVHGKDDVYKLLEKGQERRKTATTLMNDQSSRSHTVFSILVHIKENGIDGEEMLKIGKLNLVDLAGSENISKAGNEKGIRTRETVNINQSLLTLGRVITSLVERTPHIPYRESKLTRLLQESLGGRTKTSIIATISPGHKDIDETLSTLEYAHRAKNIQNKPEINQKLTKKTVLKEYTEEIDRLKRDLMAARDKNGVYLAEVTYNEMTYKLESQNKELNEQILTLKAMKEEMLKKEALFNEVNSNLMEKTEELQRTEKVLNEAKFALTQTKKALNTTKKRYKEKKVILGNHIKTEEKLTNQASELIEVADIATNDHILLQETLERRKKIDNEIKSVTGEFKNKFENSFKGMNKDFEELQQKHKSISEIIKDEINKNVKIINSNINNTKVKINCIATICEKSFNNFYTKYDELTKILQHDDEKNKKVFEELLKMQREKDEISRRTLNNYLNETKNILIEHKELERRNTVLLSELISESNKKDDKFCETLNNHLNTIVTEVNQVINDEGRKIKDEAGKRSELNQKKNEILLKMENLMSNLKDLELEDSKRNVEMQTISENMSSIAESISKKINQEIETVKIFSGDKNNYHSNIQNNLMNFENEFDSKTSQIHDKINIVEDSISNICLENSEFENKIIELISENKDIRTECITENSKKLLNEKNSSTNSIQIQCKESESIIFENHTNFNEHSVQNTALTNSLIEAVEEYGSLFKQKIKENHLQLNQFYENELKIYTPTGQTPSKKEFSYPKVLARTSPHTNIIKRFRLENDYSDLDISNTTISEEDSQTTIIDIDNEMQMPRRSTPIKNLENSTKSIDLNIRSLTENSQNTPSLGLNIFENKKYSFSNKENIG